MTRIQRQLAGPLVLLLISMLAATAAFTGGPAVTRAQTDTLATAALTPDTAPIYLAINTDQESDQWQQSTALLERAGLGDLIDQAMADLAAEGDIADIEAVLGGEVALVVTSLEAPEDLDLSGLTGGDAGATPAALAGGPSGAAVIIDASDPTATYDLLLEGLTDDADTQGAQVEETDYNGVTILSVPAPDEIEDGTAIAQVGDFVLVSSTPADLEPLIDTDAGDIGALADVENFSTLQSGLNTEFMAFGFVNGEAFAEALAADPETAPIFLGQDAATFGSESAFVLWADDPGFRVDSLTIFGPEAEVPPLESFDATLDEQVPADSLVFVNGVDLGQNPLFDIFGLAIAQEVSGSEAGATPEAGVDLEAYRDQLYADAAPLLGFNIGTDFIDQMVGEWALAVSLGSLAGMAEGSPPEISGVLVSNVDNPATLSDAISKLALLIGTQIQPPSEVGTRDVDGSIFNTITDVSSGLPLEIAYGVLGSQFIVSLGDGLDQFVSGPEEALADSEQYQEVMATLPEPYTGAVYVDVSQLLPIVEEARAAFEGMGGMDVVDADPACEEYATQEEAQAAYDEDQFTNFALDQDFDGEACEDFFNPGASPEASPVSMASGFAAIRAFAAVVYEQDGMAASSSILYIADE